MATDLYGDDLDSLPDETLTDALDDFIEENGPPPPIEIESSQE